MTVAGAAAITSRLARLAVRPRQTPEDYIKKLRSLIEADRASLPAAAALRKGQGPRAEPTLERLHGMDEAVAWGLQLRRRYSGVPSGERSWSDVDRGLLLSGPPGTGKTLFARALATTCCVPLLTGSYGAWLGTGTGHQGDLLRAMRKCFRDAKERAPSVLFIDEVDAFSDRARVRRPLRGRFSCSLAATVAVTGQQILIRVLNQNSDRARPRGIYEVFSIAPAKSAASWAVPPS